jgi:hypothetical protein
MDWILKHPSTLPWDLRRTYMRQGSFEGSAAQESAERKLIRNHFRGVTAKEGS